MGVGDVLSGTQADSTAEVLRLARDQRYADALALARERLAACGDAEREDLEAGRALAQWRAAANAGRYGDGLVEAIGAVSHLEAGKYRPRLGWVYANVGFSLGMLGDLESGITWCEKGVDDATLRGDPQSLIVALDNLGGRGDQYGRRHA